MFWHRRVWLLVAVLVGAVCAPGVVFGLDRLLSTPLPRSVAIGLFPRGVAVDSQRGRAFVMSNGQLDQKANAQGYYASGAADTGTLSVVDTRSGARLRVDTLGGAPEGIAVDEQRGHTFVESQTSGSSACTVGSSPGCGQTTTTSVSMIDTMSGAIVRTVPIFQSSAYQSLPGFYSAPASLAVDQTASHVFAVDNEDGSQNSSDVAMIDAETGSILRRVVLQPGPLIVAVDASAHRVLIANLDTSGSSSAATATLWLLDSRTGSLVHTTHLGTTFLRFLLPDRLTGRTFAVTGTFGYFRSNRQGSVEMFDTRTGALIKTIQLPAGLPSSLAIDQHTGQAYVSSGYRGARTGSVTVLNGRSGAIVRTLSVDGSPSSLAIEPRSGHLLVSRFTPSADRGRGNRFSGAQQVLVLDPGSGTVLRTVDVDSSARLLAVDAQSGHAVVAGQGIPRTGPNLLSQWVEQVSTYFNHRTANSVAGTVTSILTTFDGG